MGSLPASGIPVATKTNSTYRKRDVLITSTNSPNDVVSNLVSTSPVRTIGSGSIVRDNGLTASVEYTEEVVWGVNRMARSALVRVPSDETATRQTVVDLGDNQTRAVIETSLSPDTPQLSSRHTGNKVVIGQAVGDTVVERVANSGTY